MNIVDLPVGPAREASQEPGDFQRDGRGRPKVWVPEKKGFRSYSRTTSFIDVLEDKKALGDWSTRMSLIGAYIDAEGFFNGMESHVEKLKEDPTDRDAKRALDRLAEKFKDTAGANVKRDKGSHIHALSEYIDQNLPFPEGMELTDADKLDIAEYVLMMDEVPITFTHVEKRTICDLIGTAGTPDRVGLYDGPGPIEGEHLKAHVICDLKTGTMEYGVLKMAMQLAIYSRSVFYDPETDERTPMPEDISTSWGLIFNLPSGTGEGSIHWIDLDVGWEAVLLAQRIRVARRKMKNLTVPFGTVIQATERQVASFAASV